MHDANTSLLNVRQTFFLTLISRIKAVYYYGYKPEMRGMLVTLAQALLVFALPQVVILFLYRAMRRSYLHQIVINGKARLAPSL
jgi:hypothetical protein